MLGSLNNYPTLLSAETLGRIVRSKGMVTGLIVAFAFQLSYFSSLALQSILQPTPDLSSRVFYAQQDFQDNLQGEAFWSWSGYSDIYARKTPTAPPPAAKIDAKILLLGIIGYGTDKGYAMMKVDNKAEQLFSVGDIIKANIKVAEVGLDFVVLSSGNLKKSYNLHKEDKNIFLKRHDPPAPKNIVSNAPAAQPRPQRPGAVAPPPRSVSISALPKSRRDRFTNFQNKVNENPLSASNDLDVNAVNKNGRIYGYRVNYRIDPSLLRSIGLLPTDVIISVNGIPAQQIAQDTALQNRLMSQKSFVIIYDRNGVTNTLNVNI